MNVDVCIHMYIYIYIYIYIYAGILVVGSDSAKMREIKVKIYLWRKMQGIWKNKVHKQVHKIVINIC